MVTKKTKRVSSVLKYAAIPALVGAMGSHAQADISVLQLNQVVGGDGSPTGFFAYDLDGDGNLDIFAGFDVISGFVSVSTITGQRVATEEDASDFARGFSNGDVINYSDSFSAGLLYVDSVSSLISNPNATFVNPDSPVYMGFTFNSTEFGDVFAWADVSVTVNEEDGDIVDMRFNRMAFDTTGAEIKAGAVPEPGAFGLLALGAAMVLPQRRRK